MSETKEVYTIVKIGEQDYWQRVGMAFVNKDSSWNVKLNALPVNGTLQIRDKRILNGAAPKG